MQVLDDFSAVLPKFKNFDKTEGERGAVPEFQPIVEKALVTPLSEADKYGWDEFEYLFISCHV